MSMRFLMIALMIIFGLVHQTKSLFVVGVLLAGMLWIDGEIG